MSENALKRIAIVMARGYGNRFDPNIQLSLRSIHELLETCFPNHDYGLKTVHLYLSRLFGDRLVSIVPGGERSMYRLTEHGFRQAQRYWAIRLTELGYVEPTVPLQPRMGSVATLGREVERLTASAWINGNSTETTPVI